MRSITLIFLLGLLSSSQSYAQMRQMIWPLPLALALDGNGWWQEGPKLFLDFHTNPPTLLEFPNDSLWDAQEPISSICNRWGQLLFYSDNHRVWNRSHELVENIINLHSNIPSDRGVFSTVANATILLPLPDDSLDRYFVLLNMDYSGEGAPPIYLQYSILDRYGGSTGQGALMGQGVPQRPLGDVMIQEKMTAVKHANGRDWWVICRKAEELSWDTNSDTLISLLVTPNGIDTILYFLAPRSQRSFGNMKASQNGALLAETTWALDETISPFASRSVVYIYSFDRCNGKIVCTDSLVASTGASWYGLEFSPNSKLLYVGDEHSMQIYQVQILGDTIAHVEQVVNFSGQRFFGQFLLGPDQKIYCKQGAFWDAHDLAPLHLGVIIHPDENGVACGYDPGGIYLNGNSLYGVGLPNHPNYDLGPLRGSICDSLPDPVIASVPVQAAPSDFSVTLYPNPTSQEFTVVSSNADMVELVIYNALGKEIWRTKNVLQRMSVSVAEWPMGIYTVIASTANGVIAKKQLVIQR